MSHREAKEWAEKLQAMKTAWKLEDALREKAAAEAKGGVDPSAVDDPENGKVFHYEKECSILDEFYTYFLGEGVVKRWDVGSMKARVEADNAAWTAWVEEEAERHDRINAAYKTEGKTAPDVALPTNKPSQTKGPERQVKRRHGSFVITQATEAVAEPEKPAKRRVRFVLPGDPDDPWEQEVPAGQQRNTLMIEEAAATNDAWAKIVASMEHGEGKPTTVRLGLGLTVRYSTVR